MSNETPCYNVIEILYLQLKLCVNCELVVELRLLWSADQSKHMHHIEYYPI